MFEIGVQETIDWLEAEAKCLTGNKPDRLMEARHYVELYKEYKERIDWLLGIFDKEVKKRAHDYQYWDGHFYGNNERRWALSLIDEQPTIQPTGRWIYRPGMNEQCSACGQYFPLSYFKDRPFDIKYCPHCGAKMEESK